MGVLIAIEGIDGAGKGTQSRRLFEHLRSVGVGATVLSFPRYAETRFGGAIGDFLNGRFGQLDQVSPFLASLLYAGDRFESKASLFEALQNHDVVILDRYVASNVAHQGAKAEGAERSEIVDWIHHVEYDLYQLPRAALTLLLDLPVEQAQQLILRKQARSYTDKAADLHEADGRYLAQVRDVYLQLAASESNWQTVACTEATELRSIDAIAEEIAERVDSFLAQQAPSA